MKVKIRRIDKSVLLPAYLTGGASALDLYVREKIIVEPKKIALIPLNVAIKLPRGHFGLLAARSSLPKRGLFIANGLGIFDEDFAGNNDEYKAFVYNFTDQPVVVEKGDRIVQLIILPHDRVEWEETDDLGSNDRGGIGTTGK